MTVWQDDKVKERLQAIRMQQDRTMVIMEGITVTMEGIMGMEIMMVIRAIIMATMATIQAIRVIIMQFIRLIMMVITGRLACIMLFQLVLLRLVEQLALLPPRQAQNLRRCIVGDWNCNKCHGRLCTNCGRCPSCEGHSPRCLSRVLSFIHRLFTR